MSEVEVQVFRAAARFFEGADRACQDLHVLIRMIFWGLGLGLHAVEPMNCCVAVLGLAASATT